MPALTRLPRVFTSAAMLLAAPAFATNGYFTHGIGTYNKAQAGAGVASPEQAIDAANNAASGVFVGDRLDVGAAIFSPRRGYRAGESQLDGQRGAFTVDAGKVDSGREYFAIPYLAKNWRLGDDRAVSAVFYGRGGMNTDYSDGSATFDPDGPGPAPVATRPGPFGAGAAGVNLNQAFLEVAWSWRIGRLAVGVAPVLAVQAFEARGVGSFAGFTRSFAASGGSQLPMDLSDNGTDFSVGVGAKAGAIWQATDRVALSVAYQAETQMQAFDKYADLFAEQGDFDIPAVSRVGVSWQASDRLRLHLDMEHAQYSDVDSVGNALARVFACPTAGAGGIDAESCFGGDRGAGFGWGDVTTYKVGGSYRPDDSAFTYRFGYNYGAQPIDAADAVVNILAPGVVEQHFTLGVNRKRRGGGEVGIAFMFAPEKTVRGPNAFDPTQIIELSMRQFELEFTLSW